MSEAAMLRLLEWDDGALVMCAVVAAKRSAVVIVPSQEDQMDLKLKTISKSGIGEAIAKAELYRYLNEPEEAESICRDILAADPQNMLGLRMLGLSITDQFEGRPSDRYNEVEKIFDGLKDAYERSYYTGLLCERRVKAQLRAGRAPHTLLPLLEKALQCFAEAEKIRPAGNDDAILRWNRCVRLLKSEPEFESEEPATLEAWDSPPN
jgi:tetratricopeptide (TPR) repeat protein